MFSTNLKNLRIAQGIKREQLAKEINVSVHTIAKYEQNKVQPSLETIDNLVKRFNVRYDTLLSSETKWIKTDKGSLALRELSDTDYKSLLNIVDKLPPDSLHSLKDFALFLLNNKNK